ncbi:MAG: BatA and WFA domain-containing protein [Planctomycetota bacterium]
MNWVNMMPWYQWLIFAVVPPLILILYFLKLRRVPVEVPSTYLWSRTVEDLHVNSIWQRLRNNILLWLQLLTILLLALSCFNPGCEGTQLVGERFIFVVDRSASMSVTDLEGDTSRLEEAKRQLKIAIEQMKSNDAAMIISFHDSANVVQSYTTSKSTLKQKVDNISQSQHASDLEEAMKAASGLANPGRISDRQSGVDVQVADALAAKMLIFTDGAVKKIPRFQMGNLSAEYRPIGSLVAPPQNIGITALSINDQLADASEVQAFARLQNSGLEDQTVGLSLFVDGKLTDAKRVTIPGIDSTTTDFDLTDIATQMDTSLPIELRIDESDPYLQDNIAKTVLNPPRMVNVLVVSDDSDFLEYALTTSRLQKFAVTEFQKRSYLKTDDYKNRSLIGRYDLIIFDQCVPESMPSCSTVFWGSIPPEKWSVEKTIETTPLVDVNNAHPIMFDLRMGRVNILESAVLKGPLGNTTLLQSTEGPVMVIGPRGSFEDLVIGFPLSKLLESGDTEINSDWPKNLSFPFFVQNMVVTLGGVAQFGGARDYVPGELIRIRPRIPYQEIEVTTPDGVTEQLKVGSDQRFVFTNTERCGVYEVRGKDTDEVDHLFTVNLFDPIESDIAVREKLEIGLEEFEGTRGSETVRKNLWTWLLLLGLVVLTIEWYIYNQRVFI